jgi:DNA helicase-2/ATP-dependent DNA helicase PcrA
VPSAHGGLLRHPHGGERLTDAPSAHGGFNPYNQDPGEQAEQPGFAVGSRVRHPVWGVGTIQTAEGVGEEARVVVAFRSAGTKKLAVKFARLEPA